MISLYISPSEIDRIFIEGYSGESAKIQNLNGDGIGLYMTKRVLERISAKILLKQREQHTYNNIIYQRNVFYIEIAVENGTVA
jgi:signal transduction histidine kinase